MMPSGDHGRDTRQDCRSESQQDLLPKHDINQFGPAVTYNLSPIGTLDQSNTFTAFFTGALLPSARHRKPFSWQQRNCGYDDHGNAGLADFSQYSGFVSSRWAAGNATCALRLQR
jgi:hypothetical protein